MIISFAWTTGALKARKKTVTRRDWSDEYARRFRPGQIVDAYDQSPRRGGKKIGTIRVIDVRKEPLSRLCDDAEYAKREMLLEGDLWNGSVADFIGLWNEDFDTEKAMWRLEFEIVSLLHEQNTDMSKDKNIIRRFRVRTFDFRKTGPDEAPEISEKRTKSLQSFLGQAAAAVNQIGGSEIAAERTCCDVFLFRSDRQRVLVGKHTATNTRQRIALDTAETCIEHLDKRKLAVEAAMVRHLHGLMERAFDSEPAAPDASSDMDFGAMRRELLAAAGTDTFSAMLETFTEQVEALPEDRRRIGVLYLEGQLLIHKKRLTVAKKETVPLEEWPEDL